MDRINHVPLAAIDGLNIRRGIPHNAVVSTGTVPVYSVRGLRENLKPVGFADLPTPRFGEEYLIRPGDILISLDNPGPKNALLVDGSMPHCTVSQQIMMLRIEDSSALEASFLFAWVCGPDFQDKLARLSRGLAMPRARLDDVRRIPIPLPPVEEQHRIGTRLQQLEAAADTHLRVADAITRLRELHLTELSNTYAGDFATAVHDE